MSDPITGMEVPVLAVTLHPQTRQWLTLGGTYCNPLTKTMAPLELGGPMKDPVTEGIVPILGVGLDEHTGLLETVSTFYPVAPAWLSCPTSPSLPSSSCSGQARNDTPFSLSTPPLLPTFPLLRGFPLLLSTSITVPPRSFYSRGKPKRAGSSCCQCHGLSFFLSSVMQWPCPAFLLPDALHVLTTSGLFST